MLSNLDYKVKRTEDTVLIDVNNWIYPSTIEIHKITGKSSISYITKVLDIHKHSEKYENCPLEKDNTILLTRVASEVAPLSSFQIDEESYYSAPIAQVLGYFKDNKLAYDSLVMLYDKLLVEKLDKSDSDLLQLPESNEMIGRVLKIGDVATKLNINDIVLIKDNVSTPITLDGKQYYGLEEKAVVGIFRKDFKTENIEFINESILMKEYHATHVLNSSILITPDLNYEDLDYSDIHNRDLFQIKYLDKSLKDLNQEDILLVKRDFTNYAYLNQEKYHLINGKDWIEAKIEE